MERSCETATKRDSDGTLVAAARRGDRRAFEELVLRHRQRVLAVAQRITKSREDAEDVAQESFHKAFLHLDTFQEKSQFYTWLTRIAMNEAFMLLRRRRAVFEVSPVSADDEAQPSSESFVDRGPGPEETCWQRERTQLLTNAINRLVPTIRTTILLCDVEERSAQETAKILGASLSAIKSRISRGRRKLRRTLHTRFLRGPYTASRSEASTASAEPAVSLGLKKCQPLHPESTDTLTVVGPYHRSSSVS
jgi:RNA polymerase sigma-70 factor, ECF subfamily